MLQYTKFQKHTSIFLMAALSSFFLLSCSNDNDNPEPIDEEETITTMNVSLLSSGNPTVTLQARDLDGDGPNPPVITVSGPLSANTTYQGSIELLNETVNPAEDISEEVAAEAEEHQFFFDINGSIDTAAATDQDANGNPLGLSFQLVTAAAGNGTLSITLRHEPKKPNDGSLFDAGGETDIAQSFSLVIQ